MTHLYLNLIYNSLDRKGKILSWMFFHQINFALKRIERNLYKLGHSKIKGYSSSFAIGKVNAKIMMIRSDTDSIKIDFKFGYDEATIIDKFNYDKTSSEYQLILQEINPLLNFPLNDKLMNTLISCPSLTVLFASL